MRTWKTIWVGGCFTFASLLAMSGTATATGFQINEHSAAAMGRGNAVVATVADPSAVFHNPAGLTNTEGTQFEVGVTFISPHAAYEGHGIDPTGSLVSQSASTQFIPVPNAYITRALSPKAFVGFGVFAPYGLRIEWEDPNFVGRTNTEQGEIRTFFLNPSIALKLSDTLSVAVGVSLVPATIYVKRALGAEDNLQVLFPTTRYSKEGTVELSGSAFGVGANAGIQARFDKLRFGFTFRSAVDLAFTGNANFDVPSDVPAAIAARFPDGDIDAELTLPHSFGAGIGWEDGPLSLELGGQLTLWSSVEELRINFTSQLPVPAQVQPRNWKTVPLLKAGGEYRLDDSTALRAGLGYDVNPIPDSTIDPILPDSNRVYFTLGGGYSFGAIHADLAYMGLITFSRDADKSLNFVQEAGAKYPGGMTHLIALSLGAKL